MTDNGQIRRIKIADLIPDKRNANLHTERGVYMVSRSLEKLGAGRSILIDKDNEIIAGNLTAEQAADMGLEEVIIVPTDGRQLVAVQRIDMDLDDPATGAREMAYADNRAAVVSIDFDPEQVKLDFDAGLDLGDWWQDFELEELGVVEPAIPEDVPPQIDRAEELREKWGVELGQLWRLPSRTAGQEHRVICGDCTDKAVVERVIFGDVPLLMIADPPYGIEHKNDAIPTHNHKEFEGIANDSRNIEPFAENFIRAQRWLRGTFYIFGAYVQLPVWYPLLNQWRKINQVLAWVKDNPVLSRLHFNLQFELIYNSYDRESIWNGDNTQNDVLIYRNVNSFGYIKDDGSRNAINDAQIHPHQKPLDLIAELIKLSSDDRQAVYDPFVGSGTTIIAAENLSRQCRAIEISPGYVAVSLQRYLDTFGIESELLDS